MQTMDFSVQGKPTPHSYQRHLPGSARRQTMSRNSQINPITGEEMCTTTKRIAQQPKTVKTENTNGVPLLNLDYLKDDDYKARAIEIDLNDYSLDTPNSAHIVSCSTHRPGTAYGQGGKSHMLKTVISNRTVQRPDGVPELSLGNGKLHCPQRKSNQPSAWDGDPIPFDLPQPSTRYKEMYQQYTDEMKQSYRDHVATNQKGVENSNVRLLSAQAETNQDQNEQTGKKNQEPSEIILSDRWSQQHCTRKQLLKKKDAEDLLEQNKKLKLVETVMIDQLSRAVISDPEQNDLHTNRPTLSCRGRGTNRHLHDSKISTRATATENLLSRMVRFGARILTRNGHDALRELTGFYFDFDQTLTVYEFRQFGKSAKAMPFIYRGQYIHMAGPKRGLPYSLSDIYTGANVKIPTEGQLALTDALSGKTQITLRITDVDECERRLLLAEKDTNDEKLHALHKIEINNREYMHWIQDQVQKQIRKRGIQTITGLSRYYRKLDHYNTGILDQYDLEKGLKAFHIDLNMEQLEQIFDILDPEGSKLLDYRDYIQGVIGEMSESRKILVRKAFLKLDSCKMGATHISDAKKFFNVNSKYRPSADVDTHISALQAFLDAVRENEKQEHILYLEFEEYYEGLSVELESDESFANVLCNTWNI